jgi:hypothetical protein
MRVCGPNLGLNVLKYKIWQKMIKLRYNSLGFEGGPNAPEADFEKILCEKG